MWRMRIFVLFTTVYSFFLLPCEKDGDCSDLTIFGKHTCINFQCLSYLDYSSDYKMIFQNKVITTTTTTTATTTTTTTTATTTTTTTTTTRGG